MHLHLETHHRHRLPVWFQPSTSLFVDMYHCHILQTQVHHLLHLKTTKLQVAAQDILKNIGPEITDSGIVIDRRPARIHAHIGCIDGGKLLLGAGECIVQVQHVNSFGVPARIVHSDFTRYKNGQASDVASR